MTDKWLYFPHIPTMILKIILRDYTYLLLLFPLQLAAIYREGPLNFQQSSFLSHFFILWSLTCSSRPIFSQFVIEREAYIAASVTTSLQPTKRFSNLQRFTFSIEKGRTFLFDKFLVFTPPRLWNLSFLFFHVLRNPQYFKCRVTKQVLTSFLHPRSFQKQLAFSYGGLFLTKKKDLHSKFKASYFLKEQFMTFRWHEYK